MIPVTVLEIFIEYIGSDVETEFLRTNWKSLDLAMGCSNEGFPLCVLLARLKEILANKYMSKDFFSRNDVPLWVLEDNIDVLPWTSVFSNPSTPYTFVMKHRSRDVNFMSHPGHTQEFLINEIRESKNESIIKLGLRNGSLFGGSIDLIENLVNELLDVRRIDANQISLSISSNPRAPIKILRKYKDYILWDRVYSLNERLALEFLQENMDNINWRGLSRNKHIPIEFIIENAELVDWYIMGENSKIPYQFFKENPKLIYFTTLTGLCHNPSVPYKFILETSRNFRYMLLRPSVIYKSYNIPIDEVSGDTIDWMYICQNRGFWLRIAKHELMPILKKLFGHS